TFAVDVAQSYYNVLQNLDRVSNNYDNLKSSRLSYERERAWQEEGERTASEVARLESQVLSADSSWTNSIVGYKRNLDNFKILLGFPTDAALILDDAELKALEERDIQPPTLSTEEAIEIALLTRLDLHTDRDRVDDSFRQIKLAANDLKGGLGLLLTGSVPSKSRNRPASFDFANSVWTAGLDLDLPLDRKAERNNYRRALINYEVSLRTLDLATDNIKLQVRNAWRTLDQAQKDYEINLLRVDVEKRRVEEITIKAEGGLPGATINDQVDAQNALTAAETSLTDALVRHTISLLELWRDVGILHVKKNGQWEEILNA
ncbi:MAG: TolC family protein, partial [Candidatus Hydrogenedentes bacterium]|nr:TolC family protein [Candidatus Hydrogenedentota bacterium]